MIDPLLSSQQAASLHQAGEAQAAETPRGASSQRYQVRRELGRGFSSIVYEALDTVRGRTVALKVLTLGQSLSDERRQDMAERFLREARAISALSHPNIVSIYEVGQAGDGRHFISMEMLSGESLRARMDREAPLGPEDAVPIALQTADALEYAHARGIVHRDVKPDNIYVLPDGRVKLMDFGVAHIVSEGTLTQTGTVVGSPAYMSPEQISGLPLSGSSDVFSLGVTLAEMLTGHKPFDAPSIPAVMNRILHRPPQIEGVQPRTLRKVLDKALAKPQAARYAGAGAFAEALRRQVTPGFASALSTDTIIMPSPLPRPRAVVPDASPALTDLPQEPPSRAALWTFGVAGLALLACAPFALSHLSPASTPTASASVRKAQTADARVPAAQVIHIPAAWGRQPTVTHAAVRTQARHATTPAPAVRAATPKPAILAAAATPKPVFVPPAPPAHAALVAAAAPKHGAAPVLPARPFALMPQFGAGHTVPASIRTTQLAAAKRILTPPHHAQAMQAQAVPHAAPMRVAATPPAQIVAPKRSAPPVVRVAASREEQRLVVPAPASRPASPFPAPAPRPLVIPDSPPRVLRRPAAVYPDALRAGGIGGSVLLRLSVNAQGAVTEATVVRSSGSDDLDAAALDAVGHWFYEPAYQGGQAVPSAAGARVDFRP